MSVSLHIALPHPVSLPAIRAGVGRALQQILSLCPEPAILVQFNEEDSAGDPSIVELRENSRSLLCSLENEPEQVSIWPFTVPACFVGPVRYEEAKLAGVSRSNTGSPLEYALMAAAALALARETNSEIEDTSIFFTNKSRLGAEEFLAEIKLKDSFPDYRKAASVFYEKLPQSEGIKMPRWFTEQYG